MRIFFGATNLSLAQDVASYKGLNLGKIDIKHFANGETYVQLQESVRGCDVFLVQPTCAPTNKNLMELLVMIDACRRASARTITAVIPYFGYARAGGKPVILDYLAGKKISPKDLEVVSPDVGGIARACGFAKMLSDATLAIVDKRRQGHNVSEVMNLIGDVKGKVAVLVDDMMDTAGTITNAAALLQEGASAVYARCTHAVFSPAIERLSGGLFQEVIVTNTSCRTELFSSTGCSVCGKPSC